MAHGYNDDAAIARTLAGRLRSAPNAPPAGLALDPAARDLARERWTFQGRPIPADQSYLYRILPPSP